MLSGEGGEVRGNQAINQIQELPALGISTYQQGTELAALRSQAQNTTPRNTCINTFTHK